MRARAPAKDAARCADILDAAQDDEGAPGPSERLGPAAEFLIGNRAVLTEAGIVGFGPVDQRDEAVLGRQDADVLVAGDGLGMGLGRRESTSLRKGGPRGARSTLSLRRKG